MVKKVKMMLMIEHDDSREEILMQAFNLEGSPHAACYINPEALEFVAGIYSELGKGIDYAITKAMEMKADGRCCDDPDCKGNTKHSDEAAHASAVLDTVTGLVTPKKGWH